MNTDFIQKLTTFVEANLANEAFGIDDIAREMGMSHSNLHRKLRTVLNQNISQFIREVRLKKAKELLLNEDLTVAEVSYRVGFGSPTYFSKCFHDCFGFSPGELRNQQPEPTPDEIPVDIPIRKNKQTKLIWLVIIGLIFLIPFSFFMIKKTIGSKAAIINEKSIAVLPFKYLSGEADKQYLADGMMDAILLHLSKIKDLRVISRTSVEQYRNSDKTILEIGKELGVAYLLEGSFQKDGDRVRVILQLLKTKKEEHAWANEYNQNKADVFMVQSEIAETIAGELQAFITPEEKQLIRKVPTTNLSAYDFYQRGISEFSLWEFASSNKDKQANGLKKAQILFEKAVKCDSTFALAYTGLARTYWAKHYWGSYFQENFLDSVLILTDRAIHFDNKLAEAHTVRAYYYAMNGSPEEAINEYNTAIKLNPNDWEAYSNAGMISHWVLDDFQNAIRNFHESEIRNRGKDLPVILKRLGRAYLDAGFIEKAKQIYQDAFKLDEDSAEFFSNMVLLNLCKENFKEALACATHAYEIDSSYVYDLPLYNSLLGQDKESYFYARKYAEDIKKSGDIVLITTHRIGYSFWKAGKHPEAKYYFNQQLKFGLESIRLGRWVAIQKAAHYDLAATYAFLGEKEKAYQYLDEFNTKHAIGLWWYLFLKYDPLFVGIRNEDRFQKILKSVETKYRTEHERVKKWLAQQEQI